MKDHTRSKGALLRRLNGAAFARRRRPAIRFSFGLLLALFAFALLAGPDFYSSPAGAQTGRAQFQNDLSQVFVNHEELQLDARVAAEQVQRSGHLSLVTAGRDFEIQLRPNDLRAPNYRAEEVVDGVTRAVQMPPINTYRGSVEGMSGTDARFTVDSDHVEGMIITPQASYFLESAVKYSRSATANDYLLYKGSDVRPDITRSCGTLDEEISRGAKNIAPQVQSGSVAPAVFSPMKVVEIATETDAEYTTALGGSAAANNDILSIMNGIQAIYQRDLGVTFTVVFQHNWTDAATDPYNATGNAIATLREFTDYWNSHALGPQRDVAHLWTNRSLGGPSGVAWTGVVCLDPAAAYGISDLETGTPFRITIPAHEIGHNFGAGHPEDPVARGGCDSTCGCENSIMVTTQNQSNTSTFCQFSINQIMAFINANSGCLSNAPAGNPIDGADFFVKQQYLDFLNRTADASGLAFWTNEINTCGADANCIQNKRIQVSAAFFLSIEFQQTGYLVERIYKTAYGDADGNSNLGGAHKLKVPIVRFAEFIPDTQQIGAGVIVGQNGWEAVLARNKQAYVDQFVTLKRFTDKYPTQSSATDTTFVLTLNSNAGNPLTPAEALTLTADYTTGKTGRSAVLRQIAEHQNLANSEFNRAFVLMQYFGYLRRNPNDPPDNDYSGYDFWLTKLNQFSGNYQAAEMVKAFINATEYRQRFGTP